MGYAALETSFAEGSELRLFLFETHDGVTKWGYTTNREPVTLSGVTYVPEVISATSMRQSASGDSNPVTITVPFDNPVAALHVPYLPYQPIKVMLLSVQRNDMTLEVKQGFSGKVTGFAMKDALIELLCAPTDELAQQVPWAVQKPGCVLATYSERCGVNMETFGMDVGAITSFAATTIQAAAFATKPDGWFRSGFIRNTATGETRFITEHTGDTIKVVYPFSDMALDLVLRAYAGDDHTAATCHAKFNNKVNYLGWDHSPTYNVFAHGTSRGSNNRSGLGGSSGVGPGDRFPLDGIRDLVDNPNDDLLKDY
jgi:uncharacterized phage protein (TIGR02218 family)